jgi:hypothetical protein
MRNNSITVRDRIKSSIMPTDEPEISITEEGDIEHQKLKSKYNEVVKDFHNTVNVEIPNSKSLQESLVTPSF